MGIEVRDEVPAREVKGGMKSPLVVAIIMVEELVKTVEFLDAVGGAPGEVGSMTTTQRKLWERYKSETVRFARHMRIAGGDVEELEKFLEVFDVEV